MGQNQWKDFLLKSSLPLEHAVASMFSKFNFYSWGEYAYERKDESGARKEFTVDLHCFKEYSGDHEWLATLDVLIECKYSSPGIQWVFAPHPEKSQVFSRALGYHDGLTGKKVDIDHLNEFERSFCECIRGIALQNNSFDPSVVSTAANQVRYALPHIVTHGVSSLLHNRHSDDLNIRFFAGIVVTNAPLYVMKDFSCLSNVECSEQIDDICEKVDSLVVSRNVTPLNMTHLNQKVKEEIINNECFKNRCDIFGKTLHDEPGWYNWIPNCRSIENLVYESGDSIIVVSLDRLDKFIEHLDDKVEKTVATTKRIFDISLDAENLIEKYTQLIFR